MTDVRKLHRRWLNNPAYRRAYRNVEAEFGAVGGIVAIGTPEDIARVKEICTGQYLKSRLAEKGKAKKRA